MVYVDPNQYKTGVPEIDRIPYDEKYTQQNPDLIETYGGIIEKLTSTEKLLMEYEFKLQGKRFDTKTNSIIEIPSLQIRMDEAKAIEFVDMLRSIVNQNTHFSNFDDGVINNILLSANYSINRWLMFQGESVPLRHRPKIAFEAMNMIIASLYKSNNGTILDWTKGSFSVGEDNKGNNKQSNMFMPWTWGKTNS